jgi:PAS domain S-box-containing protein
MQQGGARGLAYVVNVYSILGFLSVTIFGVLHILVEHNRTLGFLEIIGGLVILLNVLSLRVTGNIGLARDLFLSTMAAMLIVMLATGGTSSTGIFWFFLFPIAAFFLTDRRRGVYWTLGLMAVVSLLWLLSYLDLAELWYSGIVVRQLVISVMVVTAAIYVYEKSREIAERRGDESQQDLQEYLDHMTTYSAKIDVTGKVLFANRAAKEATGLGEHLVGVNFIEGPWWGFDSAVKKRVQVAFQRALAGEAVKYDERFRIERVGGYDELAVNFSMIPIRQGKQTAYVLAEARDITHEQELDRSKSEFVTLASHQLRTPISAIRWFSEMLLNDDAGSINKEQREHLEEIYRSNQRMANLVDEMLIVSSLELGDLPVSPELLDPADFCRKAVKAQTTAAVDKHIRIRETYDQHLPKLLFDPQVLKIIVRNVLANAVKYTPEKGSISFEVTRTNKQLVPGSKGSLVIMVNDSGYGIPSADRDQIFTKFFRASNIKDKDTDGTGLGLYMIKMLLEYVGGTISFTSTEGVGSTFVLELPLEGMVAHQPISRPVKAK